MYPEEDAVINEVMLEIKAECPKAFDLINLDIENTKKNHEYYWSINRSLKWVAKEGMLIEKLNSSLERFDKALKIVFEKEIVGVWKGTADGTNETITLQINDDKTMRLVREWDDSDGEHEYQEYRSAPHAYRECNGLIVCDLWNGQRVTNIRVALFPNITHTKTMDGSMFMFQDEVKSFCMRVEFEYLKMVKK
ncbi:hypothetical protein FLL45_15760 [Aliikangiella marina]|uniref:Uncharacterized protein n=1 Tax=Aliikangiella marina TaxID=1712262 RepID=A0A545T6R4_9GAMM|nr:hypothetical protein [Aliikangiella marina]TQV72920.1 hypothetical protein FLL45_15760 [Aliikangiella marina]